MADTRTQVKRALQAVGVSGDDAREIARWARNRSQMIRRLAGIHEADAVVWSAPGVVELRPVEVVGAGSGEVTVEIDVSMVSPGTERAQYLGLPNARVAYPFRPGYSGAGRVVRAGSGVSNLRVGDRVAVSGMPHQRRVTAPADAVVPIGDSVSLEAAAFVELGVIAGQGVDKAAIGDAVPFVVVGAGPIGLLAQRTARALGAGQSTVVARTRARRWNAQAGGAHFVALQDEPDIVEKLRAPVVIEAAGSDQSLDLALRLAEPGGRVVVLGSDRTPGAVLDAARIAEQRLTVIGAHVRTLELSGEGRRRCAERFLAMLADETLGLDGLEVEAFDPADAAIAYRRMAEGSVDLACFDWRGRAAPASRWRAVRPPRLVSRGARFDAEPVEAPVAAVADPITVASDSAGFALVGCGEIALRNAEAVARAPNGHLISCYDTAAALSEDLAERHDIPAVASLDGVLADPAVDVVILSVPHHLHAPLAVQALQAGKAVIVEKPPANDLAGAVAMARASVETGRPLSVCFPHRFERRSLEARHLIAGGALGRLSGFQVTWYQDKPPSYWIGGYSGRSTSSWRSSKELAGGGALVMNASHYLDLLLHLTDARVESVMAMTAAERASAEVEDHVVLVLRLDNGVVGSLTACSSVRGTRSEEIRIWGLDGHVELAPRPRSYLLRAVAGHVAARWQALPADDVPYRAAYMAQFVSDLAAGRPPAVGLGAMLDVQALMEAAYRSAEIGQAVRPGDLLAEAGWSA